MTANEGDLSAHWVEFLLMMCAQSEAHWCTCCMRRSSEQEKALVRD